MSFHSFHPPSQSVSRHSAFSERFSRADHVRPVEEFPDSEKWWPQTDTRAEWGAPPKQANVELVKDVPSPELKTQEETCEVSFSTNKVYYKGEMPQDPGTIGRKTQCLTLPERPFKIYVNGGAEMFDSLRENIQDTINRGNDEQNHTDFKPGGAIRYVVERSIEKNGNSYQIRTKQTFVFPRTARITFYIASNFNNSTDVSRSPVL